MLEIKFTLHKNNLGQRRCWRWVFCLVWYYNWHLCMGDEFLRGCAKAFLRLSGIRLWPITIIKRTCVYIIGSWNMKQEGEGVWPDSDISHCNLIQKEATSEAFSCWQAYICQWEHNTMAHIRGGFLALKKWKGSATQKCQWFWLAFHNPPDIN